MEWFEKLDGNVIVSDAEWKIIYMNEAAKRNYASDGGGELIGKNIMECHNKNTHLFSHFLKADTR